MNVNLRLASNATKITRSDEWRDIKRVISVEENTKAAGTAAADQVLEVLQQDLYMFIEDLKASKVAP